MVLFLVDSREENAKDEDLKRLSQMEKNVTPYFFSKVVDNGYSLVYTNEWKE